MKISDIKFGERRREELGDLDALAESIKKYGLIEPIVVDQDGNLVAGQRRLLAAEKVGLKDVPVRLYEDLSLEQRLGIELEENIRRKELTPYEASKRLVEQARQVEHLLTQQPEIPPSGGENSPAPRKRGRPRKVASQEGVAAQIGVSQQRISEAQSHERAGESYHELRSPEFSPRVATEIAASLDALPEPERERKRAALQAGDEAVRTELSPHLKRQAARKAATAAESESPRTGDRTQVEPDRPRQPKPTNLEKRFRRAEVTVRDELLGLNPEDLARAMAEAEVDRVTGLGAELKRWFERFEEAWLHAHAAGGA